VLVELGLVEQRYKAVLEIFTEAATVTDVAWRFWGGPPSRAQLAAGVTRRKDWPASSTAVPLP
jgi:hypothetical protein